MGKTCLIKRCIENTFDENSDASIGAMFHSKDFKAQLDMSRVNPNQLDPDLPAEKEVRL